VQKFVVGVLLKLLADEKVQAFLMQIVDRLAEVLLPKLASVVPAAVAAGIKGLGDLIPDLHLPGLEEVTKDIHDGVNALLPEDIDIPFISDAFEKVTGIDLTDILTGRKRG
jgi:hypothetical protein